MSRTNPSRVPSTSVVPAALFLIATLLTVLLPGCNAPVSGSSGIPLVQAARSQAGDPSLPVMVGLQETPRPTFVLAGADATATPTPFQPLPPTTMPNFGETTVIDPLAGPTQTPLPTPTLAATLEPTAVPTLVPAPVLPTVAPELAQLPDQINVLLLGADRRPWDRQFRTDTIMLVTINSREAGVNVLSFPRDLYVNIPGYGSGRINTAWTFGGYPLLKQTFKQNFGVQIDYFALIEFATFKRVIDGLGGLNVHVGKPVSDYRAGYWITIPAGPQMMDADTVLWYVRTRKTTNDIERNRRQQEVLMAIVEKLVSMDALRRAPDFYEMYKHTVTTDIGLLDVLSWLPVGAKVIETGNVRQFYINYNHVYDYITPEGAMVLVPQQEMIMNMIRKSQNLR